jgi:serine protease AprX
MRHERPSSAGEVRSSALWGKGSGGQSRGSALWGRGGRSGVALLALVVSVIVPAAGIAGDKQHAAVPSDLIQAAEANPNSTFDVIVQGSKGSKSDQVAAQVRETGGKLKRAFRSISGVSVSLTGKELVRLSRHPNISAITRDERMGLADLSWRDAVRMPYVSETSSTAPSGPAIAIVDSGIDAGKTYDFGTRVVARANFVSSEPNVAGDPMGHGTMVAGVAASGNPYLRGVAPNAPLVDVRVASSQGEALTSDIVAAVDWILANKAQHNIRVANFSLAGTSEASFRYHPLNKAVEKLWLSGVVVVAAVGNHGSSTGPVKIPAPANDPFVISVGATDMRGTAWAWDDTRVSWSAFGHTADGFAKPELSAPGRYVTAPVSMPSTLTARFPSRITHSAGYMWMSGTSFSAPIVSGAAAAILAKRPGLSPDLVKGALMVSAQRLAYESKVEAGVGAVDIAAAVNTSSPPNPNENLHAFVANGEFDAEAWVSAVSASANWTMSNWTASNWTASNWTLSNWVSSNWVSSNWVSSNWTMSNWVASNWVANGDAE